MRNLLLLSIMIGGLSAEAQQPNPTPQDTLAKQPAKDKDTNVIYGRIKQVTKGQKIVIHVENSPDKTYNISDNDRVVRLAEGLAVGDDVIVRETEKDGNKSVDIVRNVDANKSKPNAR